jgi:hypothetical protein
MGRSWGGSHLRIHLKIAVGKPRVADTATKAADVAHLVGRVDEHYIPESIPSLDAPLAARVALQVAQPVAGCATYLRVDACSDGVGLFGGQGRGEALCALAQFLRLFLGQLFTQGGLEYV